VTGPSSRHSTCNYTPQMRKLVLYVGLFALASALSAVLPAIAGADERASTAHLQVRNARLGDSSTGDAAELAALVEFARDPQALVPDNKVTGQPQVRKIIEQGKLAMNLDKNVPVVGQRIYVNKKKLVID